MFQRLQTPTMTALEDAGMSVDDRMRVHVRDYLASSGLGEVASSSSGFQQRREICLQRFVRDHKNDTTPPISTTQFQTIAAKLGKFCAKEAKSKFGDTFVPDKKTIFCNGQQRDVNCWWEDAHQSLVVAAWKELLSQLVNPTKPTKRQKTLAIFMAGPA